MASLGMTFYPNSKSSFPSQYDGDGFAAEHGFWNLERIAEDDDVIRIPMKDGKATGEDTDFSPGFVTTDGRVWGRSVGVAVGHDGALYVADDGSQQYVWRVTPHSENRTHLIVAQACGRSPLRRDVLGIGYTRCCVGSLK